MKSKFLLLFLSIVFSLFIFEFFLRMLSLIPEINRSYQRHDIGWTEKNVVLNSAGYRSGEYPRDRSGDAFRAYVVGDSFTYGWFVDNINDVYPALIEKGLSRKLNQKVEIINAGAPGFSVNESVQRYINEGKYYHPDLVILGVNSLRVPVTGKFTNVWDPPLPAFVKRTAVYQMLVGNMLRKIAENKNHKYLENIFDSENSEDWKKYSKMIIELRDEAEKVNAKLALVVFPHVHSREPNKPYDLYQYNNRFADFGKKNGILIFDPLEEFLKYQQKEKLVINPLDAHPTPEMNRLVAESLLNNFDVASYIKNKKSYVPLIETVTIDKNNKAIGEYGTIRKIYSLDKASYAYYEIKDGIDTQSLPLVDSISRQTNYYEDMIQTVESFTTNNAIGASILYYVKPKRSGEIIIPSKIYGYDIVGFENVYGIINGDTAVSAEFIEPASIEKNGSEFVINYNENKNYYIFRLSLAVSERQLDIDSDGNVKNIVQTVLLNEAPDKDTNTIIFTIDKKISGLPQFFVSGETFAYAFVDDKFAKVKEMNYDQENNSIVLIFDSSLKKGQKVLLPVLAAYNLSDEEQIYVEVER